MYLCVVRTSGRYASYVVHSKCGCEHTYSTLCMRTSILYMSCVQVLKFHITHSSYITVPPHQEVCIQVCACVCATCIHTCTVEDMYKKELIIFISYHCALVHLLVNVVSYSTGCVPKRNIEHKQLGGGHVAALS
jgi:hypothetical protein